MESSEIQTQLERYHHEGYGWALTCCSRDPVEAEDVLQTVYLKILEGRARYNGQATFKTWFFAVIRKTAADQRRWHFFRRLRLIRYERDSGNSIHEAGCDHSVYLSQLQALFRQALTDLPKRQREVLQLAFYHDLTLDEAAGVMGISVGSARTHYDRGKKRLRQWIRQSGGLDESEFK